MTRYTIALIPSEGIPELMAISSMLASEGSSFVLGTNNPPHVSIIQLHEGQPEILWRALTPLHNKELDITLTTAYVHSKPSGSVWLGVAVEKTQELVALQEEIAKGLALPSEMYNNHFGERYFPHFTTGRFEVNHKSVPVVWNDAGLKVRCRLHLCVAGSHWQLERVIH